STPNNILGIEYMKTLMRLNSSIKPYTLKRIQADYSSTHIQNHICSATAIRNHLVNEKKSFQALKEVMPKNSFKILEKSIQNGLGPVSEAEFEQNIFYVLRKSPAHALSEIMDVTEGLENRIKKAAYQSTSYKDMLQQIKTKRYPLTRLQRIMIHSLLGITKKDISQFQQSGGPQYARILAFSSKGADILNALKETSEIPIIINVGKHGKLETVAQKMLDFDILATDIYSLGYPDKTFRIGRQDFYRKPYIQK
ncbi:MAG TPA: nucleotidyltransferase family protein, partial [Clostridiales bacterium]|nr:nucleotidyltransferase family protein [Clostridiales bacterium]